MVELGMHLSVILENLGQLWILASSRAHRRRLTEVVLYVGFGAVFKQYLASCPVAPESCDVERSLLILRVSFCWGREGAVDEHVSGGMSM